MARYTNFRQESKIQVYQVQGIDYCHSCDVKLELEKETNDVKITEKEKKKLNEVKSDYCLILSAIPEHIKKKYVPAEPALKS